MNVIQNVSVCLLILSCFESVCNSDPTGTCFSDDVGGFEMYASKDLHMTEFFTSNVAAQYHIKG